MKQQPMLLPAALLLLSVFACKDKEEQIPAYLHIEPFTVNAPGGAAAQDITEGWVYVNGSDFIGVYSLPADVPALVADGPNEILVYPGVKENGIVSTPNIYPFLTRYGATVNLMPGQTTTIQPTTAYDPTANQPWGERGLFENSSINLEDRDGDPGSTFALTTDGAYMGRSLLLAVDTAHPTLKIATETVPLPNTADRQTWLEFHHRNDVAFEIWIIGSDLDGSNETPQPVILISPAEDWDKTYLNLTDLVARVPQSLYRVYFQFGLPRNADGTFAQDSAQVRLDNLRLIHF